MKYIFGQGGSRPLRRLLSLLTAAIVAVTLTAGMGAMAVQADTADVTAEQLVAALEKLNSELEKAQPRVPVQPEPTENTDPAETGETVAPAPSEEPAGSFVDNALAKVRGAQNEVYLNQSLLEDIELCTEAVRAGNNLSGKAAQAIEQVRSCAALEEPVKLAYAAALEQTVLTAQEPADDPVDLLEEEFASLEAGIEPAPDALRTCCNALLDRERYVEHFSELTELLRTWTATERKIDEIAGRISGEEAPAAQTAALAELTALAEQGNAVKSGLAGFHTASPDEQQALLDTMKELMAETDALVYAAFAENAVEDARQQEQLDRTEAKAARAAKLAVLGCIALGVAVLAVIMGIIAEVCAVRRPKKETPDFNVIASRKDAETLDSQNRTLRAQQTQQETKLNQMSLDLQTAQAELRALDSEVRQLKQTPVIPEVKTAPPDELPKMTQQQPPAEPPKKAMMKLVYQQTCPANSRLFPQENGSYVLYMDDTLGLGRELLAQSSTLNSWRATGLLYLFNPVIDHQPLDMDRGVLPEGYFKVVGVTKRATVRRGIGEDYVLAEKGTLRITRA